MSNNRLPELKPLSGFDLHRALVDHTLTPDLVVVTMQRYATPDQEGYSFYRDFPSIRRALNDQSFLFTAEQLAKLMVATHQIISREMYGCSTFFRDELSFQMEQMLKDHHLEVAGIQLRPVKKQR